LQQLVDKAIASSYALEEKPFGAVVEEASVIPGDRAIEEKDKTQSKVLNPGFTNATQP
jgi:hypothetical protein